MQATIINFNAPELNQLAVALASRGELHRFVRPYLQHGRWWEKAAASMPGFGRMYRQSLGRRTLPLAHATSSLRTTGILEDFGASLVGRLRYPSAALRNHWVSVLQERMRVKLAEEGRIHVVGASHVVAYPGCGLHAFRRARSEGVRTLLSYPIAHHRHHLLLRDEEAGICPEFAASWPALSHFTDEYLAILDEEIELADLILVGSEYTRRTFTDRGISAERVRVCPYGVDTGIFSQSPSGDRRGLRLAFAGQIGQRKGISYLLEAFRRFRREEDELWLIGRLTGMDALPDRYLAGVRHVSHLTRQELARTLGECDVFVFPTLLEGMPLVVVEAMAAGLPVIATRNGPDEIVRHGIDGFLVPDRDPGAIVEYLERLRTDRTMLDSMSGNAAQRAREFTWDRFAARFREAMEA